MTNFERKLTKYYILNQYQEDANNYLELNFLEDNERLSQMLDRLRNEDPSAFAVIFSLLKENWRLEQNLKNNKDRNIIKEKKGWLKTKKAPLLMSKQLSTYTVKRNFNFF